MQTKKSQQIKKTTIFQNNTKKIIIDMYDSRIKKCNTLNIIH